MDPSLFNFMQRYLEGVRTEFKILSADMVMLASALAVLGAIIYIAYITFRGWLSGNYWNPQLLRPFLFLLIIALYPKLVDGIDGVMLTINNSTGYLIEPGNYRLTELLDNQNLDPTVPPGETVATSEDILLEEEESTIFELNDLLEAIGGLNPVNWIGEKIYFGFMRVIEELLFRLSQGVIMLINVLRCFLLIFLYIIGPLSLAMAVFPGFEESALTWLGRYIAVHMWLGIGNIFEAIMLEFWELVVESGGFTYGAFLLGGEEMLIANNMSWMFLFISIVGHLSIPFLAGWVVNTRNVSDAVSKIAIATKVITKV